MALLTEDRKLQQFLRTTQGKSYTVAVVTSLLVILIFIGGVYPAVSAILFQLQENQSRREALSLIEEKKQTLEQLAALEEQKRAVSVALEASLPDGEGQKKIVRNVNVLSREEGVTLLNVGFTPVPEAVLVQTQLNLLNSSLRVVEVKISVSGSRNRLENFLSEIESTRRIHNLLEVLIVNPDSENDPELFKMDLTGYAYFWERADDESLLSTNATN